MSTFHAYAAHEIGGEVLEVTAIWRDYMTDAGLALSEMTLLERCFGLRNVVERGYNSAVKTQ